MNSSLFPLREDAGVTLPGGKAGAVPQKGVAGDQPQSAGAWKREMERAQLDAWFKPQQAVSSGAPCAEDGTDQHTLNSTGQRFAVSNAPVKAGHRIVTPTQVGANPAPNRSPGMSSGTSISAQSHKQETGRGPVTDIRVASLVLALEGMSGLKVVGLTPTAESEAMVADRFNAPAEQAHQSHEVDPDLQGIRLHAEWQGQDVSVWLGIDARADSLEAQLAQLLPQIRSCLQEQRSRLIKLVCNGRTVFEVSSSVIPAVPYFTYSKEFP